MSQSYSNKIMSKSDNNVFYNERILNPKHKIRAKRPAGPIRNNLKWSNIKCSKRKKFKKFEF